MKVKGPGELRKLGTGEWVQVETGLKEWGMGVAQLWRMEGSFLHEVHQAWVCERLGRKECKIEVEAGLVRQNPKGVIGGPELS